MGRDKDFAHFDAGWGGGGGGGGGGGEGEGGGIRRTERLGSAEKSEESSDDEDRYFVTTTPALVTGERRLGQDFVKGDDRCILKERKAPNGPCHPNPNRSGGDRAARNKVDEGGSVNARIENPRRESTQRRTLSHHLHLPSISSEELWRGQLGSSTPPPYGLALDGRVERDDENMKGTGSKEDLERQGRQTLIEEESEDDIDGMRFASTSTLLVRWMRPLGEAMQLREGKETDKDHAHEVLSQITPYIYIYSHKTYIYTVSLSLLLAVFCSPLFFIHLFLSLSFSLSLSPFFPPLLSSSFCLSSFFFLLSSSLCFLLYR